MQKKMARRWQKNKIKDRTCNNEAYKWTKLNKLSWDWEEGSEREIENGQFLSGGVLGCIEDR